MSTVIQEPEVMTGESPIILQMQPVLNLTEDQFFEHRSGNPQARTVLFRGGAQIPSITVPVEPIGSIRLPNLDLLDLRVEKRFRLTKGQSLAVRVNVFNAMNINTVTTRVVRSGATYLFPTAIVLPRIFDFSASYSF